MRSIKKAVKVMFVMIAAGAAVSAVIIGIKKHRNKKEYSCDDYYDFMEETNDEQ